MVLFFFLISSLFSYFFVFILVVCFGCFYLFEGLCALVCVLGKDLFEVIVQFLCVAFSRWVFLLSAFVLCWTHCVSLFCGIGVCRMMAARRF